MNSRLSFLFAVLAGLLLTGCPTDGNRSTFDYLRSPVTFRIDPVADDHPFCSDPAKNPFPTVQECRSTRKYRMRWERPEDTVSFTEYRVYVDTTPPDAFGQTWSEVRKNRSLASYVMEGRPSQADSIIFFLSSAPQGALPLVMRRDSAALVPLDTSGRLDSLGRLVFAIVTSYRGGGIEGLPRYSWVITNDRFGPHPLVPAITPKARALEFSWSRPRDPTSFFDPSADSGMIAGYVIRVRRRGTRATTPFAPMAVWRVGGVDRSSEVTYIDSTIRTNPERRFWLPDSNRVFDRVGADPRDSLYLTVTGLSPLDTLIVTLWAVDAEGNGTQSDSTRTTTVLLTDTTQPSTPQLAVVAGSVTRNRFAYTFTASRDSVESGAGLVPAPTPNANILEYRISRRRIDSGGTSVIDSVLQVSAALRDIEVFTDTAKYLPPGATYRITIQAVDSTGHLSGVDTLVVSTLPSQFVGADSGATCPPGFIAMPEGQFHFGETAANSPQADELGAGSGMRTIKSFCIEPREHQASPTAFQSQVTWQQAFEICRDLSPADSTHLCTEAEWERACEGTETPALLYGIQSERADAEGVRYTCNIGTGDSAMAQNPALRDPSCISNDGAFDMSGNLAEWVMDPYTAAGYPGPASDTLRPGRPHTPITPGARRVFRGSTYLNPGTTPATLLRAARCSNRDYAVQVRPAPYPGCIDETRARIAVLYSDQTKLPRCFPLPDSLASLPITSLAPGRDTNQILILVQGRPNPVSFFIPVDTNYRNLKPVSALLTPIALAVVTFENSETNETVVDTLDASELLNRSETQRAAVFAREAAPPWSVRKTGGVYDIKFLYAYTRAQGVPARSYYSNRAIGFRCCSNPRK